MNTYSIYCTIYISPVYFQSIKSMTNRQHSCTWICLSSNIIIHWFKQYFIHQTIAQKYKDYFKGFRNMHVYHKYRHVNNKTYSVCKPPWPLPSFITYINLFVEIINLCTAWNIVLLFSSDKVSFPKSKLFTVISVILVTDVNMLILSKT